MSHRSVVAQAARRALVLAPLALLGCLEQVPPEAPVQAGPTPTAGVISVQVDPELKAQAVRPGEAGPELGALKVLDAARERAVSCYTKALQTNPYLYGEVIVKLELDPSGRVVQAASVMDTVGDRELVACVERLVQAQRYPASGEEGLSLRYPFLFSSDLTPPEVVRAMKLQHGLLEEESTGIDLETLDGGPTKQGTIDTW